MTNLTIKFVGLTSVYVGIVLTLWLVQRNSKGQMKRWASGLLRKLTKGYLGGE